MFRWPSGRAWTLTLTASCGFIAFALGIGLITGLFRFQLAELDAVIRVAAIAIFLPAVLEELVFRGPLLWLKRRGSRHLVLASAVSLTLFILWHPLNASVLLTDARDLFSDWRFLTIAAGLGVATTWLTLRAETLCPAILLHWLAVVGWKAFLGGPAFL